MKYSIISSMYDDDRKKVVEKKTEINLKTWSMKSQKAWTNTMLL